MPHSPSPAQRTHVKATQRRLSQSSLSKQRAPSGFLVPAAPPIASAPPFPVWLPAPEEPAVPPEAGSSSREILAFSPAQLSATSSARAQKHLTCKAGKRAPLDIGVSG